MEKIKAELLLDYYAPVKYRYGLTFPSGKGVTLSRYKGYNVDIAYSLQQHCLGNRAVAVYFPKAMQKDGTVNYGHIVAFDLDKNLDRVPPEQHEQEKKNVLEATKKLDEIINGLGLETFKYKSGKKGYHLEVYFPEMIPIIKLRNLCNIITNLGVDTWNYLDNCCPENESAYKVFGCHHPQTKQFTYAFTDDFQELSKDDSWTTFQKYKENSQNSLEKLEEIIKNYHYFSKKVKTDTLCGDLESAKLALEQCKSLPKKETKPKRTKVHTPGVAVTSLDGILQIHSKGLQQPGTRHKVAFQLGRMCRHYLGLELEETLTEVESWLLRHYPESGILYFGENANGCLSQSFEKCLDNTLESATNGWNNGFAYGTIEVIFIWEEIKKYLDTFQDQKIRQALNFLVNTAAGYKKTIFFQSASQLAEGIIKNNRSRAAILRKLEEENIFVKLKKGGINRQGKKTSNKYRLNLPNECYQIVLEENGIKRVINH